MAEREFKGSLTHLEIELLGRHIAEANAVACLLNAAPGQDEQTSDAAGAILACLKNAREIVEAAEAPHG